MYVSGPSVGASGASGASDPPTWLKENEKYKFLLRNGDLKFEKPEEKCSFNYHSLWNTRSKDGDIGVQLKYMEFSFKLPPEQIKEFLDCISNEKVLFTPKKPKEINSSFYVLRPSETYKDCFVLHSKGTGKMNRYNNSEIFKILHILKKEDIQEL